MTIRLDQLRNDIADHCVEIEDLFKVPVKVTCCVRVAGKPEQDVLVTSESNLDDVVALIERSRSRSPLPAPPVAASQE